MRDWGIVVDRFSMVSLQRQLESALRDAILSGRMRAGERILSSRELQTHLGLSRNTIVNALAQLESEGYLDVIRGVGTFVAKTLTGRPRPVRAVRNERALVPSYGAQRALDACGLSANAHGAVPFRPGIPALDLFPTSAFRRCLGPRAWTAYALDYPERGGDRDLRSAIAARLQQTRGIACLPEQVIVTGGAQAAFALTAQVLLDAGDVAIVEDPGYPTVRAALLGAGARLASVAVDDEGIDVARFAKHRAKLAHVTPSHQYPTGSVLSLERRFALLAWAKQHDAWIIEDDYDSEFNYTGKAQPALYGLGEGQRVIYVGTFSKVLAPGLRVGYLIVPKVLRRAFEATQSVTGGEPSATLQQALATFIAGGHFARHVTRMRRTYDERREAAAAEFKRAFGARAQVHDTRAGLHFVVILDSVSDVAFSQRAAKKGYIIPPLSSYYLEKPKQNGIVVGYAATPVRAAKEAIHAIAAWRF